jgi:4-hydroxybenzoate polyprenyltransferase
MRSIISGIVKTSGPIAAVFAVNPDPSFAFLFTLFIWLFFWEIGGQNIPNDLSDLDADRKIKAQTIPVRFGIQGSTLIILSSLVIAAVMSITISLVLPRPISPLYLLGASFSGFYFLLFPGYRLYQTNAPGEAFHLFNRASYYPVSMLLVTILSWVFT